jgi:hypothetical protein
MSCSRTRMVQPPSFPPQSPGLVSLLPRASEGLSPQIRVCDLLASQDDPDGGEKGELGAPKGPLCSRRHSGMFPRLQPQILAPFAKCPPLTGPFPLSPMLPRSRAERLEWSDGAVEARRSKPVPRGSANRGRNPPPAPGDPDSSHLSFSD